MNPNKTDKLLMLLFSPIFDSFFQLLSLFVHWFSSVISSLVTNVIQIKGYKQIKNRLGTLASMLIPMNY
jgi:hypothetical protein